MENTSIQDKLSVCGIGNLMYAQGYLDAVITDMQEKEIPSTRDEIREKIIELTDKSDMLEDAIFNVGLEILIHAFMTGE